MPSQPDNLQIRRFENLVKRSPNQYVKEPCHRLASNREQQAAIPIPATRALAGLDLFPIPAINHQRSTKNQLNFSFPWPQPRTKAPPPSTSLCMLCMIRTEIKFHPFPVGPRLRLSRAVRAAGSSPDLSPSPIANQNSKINHPHPAPWPHIYVQGGVQPLQPLQCCPTTTCGELQPLQCRYTAVTTSVPAVTDPFAPPAPVPVRKHPIQINNGGALAVRKHVPESLTSPRPIPATAPFQNDGDRERFLAALAEVCAKTEWQVLAWCLMRNHFSVGPTFQTCCVKSNNHAFVSIVRTDTCPQQINTSSF
jgi:hypothetical protein